MEPARTFLLKIYDKTVLERPLLVILAMVLAFSYLGYRIKDFRLDASEDSLILENDEDLAYARNVSNSYGTNDYLLLAYVPKEYLLSKETLKTIGDLRDDLKKQPRVKSVVSILDIPLLKSPPIELKNLKSNKRTLESADADLTMAADELRNSPIFKNMLVSPDLKTTAIQINFIRNPEHLRLQKRKGELLDKLRSSALTGEEQAELVSVKEQYVAATNQVNKQKHETIIAIRRVKSKYEHTGKLFLGGISMISDDMISFIRNDLKIFGSGMLAFLTLTLWVIFRRKRWIILPMLCCTLSAMSMMGILGIFGWQVTVISSNFISLQLIVTMALTIHLIVRYTELLNANPERDKEELIHETVRTIFKPCLYTSLTTIAGFSSLIFCDILPVINFGWMMSLGLVVSLVITFILFPAVLMLIPKVKHSRPGRFGFPVTRFFANVTERHGAAIFVCTMIIAGLTILGISKLKVENSFIDYFKETTEIYQGMKVIDQQLGGTTPLDIIIDLDAETPDAIAPAAPEAAGGDDFDEFDEFDEIEENGDKYWFTMKKMRQVEDVHHYLESQPAVGKVLSLRTMLTVAQGFTNGEELDNLSLALLFNELSDDFKEILVNPYVSIEKNQLRLSLRIKDSMPNLERNKLLMQIRRDLITKLGLKPEKVHLSGVMVLYNNMLQSLFSSQIQTIGFTVLALFIMFMILFRSIKISMIALFPNLLASVVVLGVMGLLEIPLDMMTITIVAISIGIAVDNTIHYIHRFRHEFPHDRNYMATMHRCHGSIGNAMYYTSITIITGFSILSLSNFIPSLLFGLLTGVAMLMALFAALTLLPRLIILIKPFGKESR